MGTVVFEEDLPLAPSSPSMGGLEGGFQHLFLMVIVQGMDGAFIAEVRKL